MRKIAIANHKGGSGKTISTYYLGKALTELGRSVLMIDFDDQATLSSKIEAAPFVYKIADVLDGTISADQAITPHKDGFSYICTDHRLAWMAVKMQASAPNHHFLRKAFRTARSFDFVLVDCPPSAGVLLINALAFVDEILIPSTPTEESYAGVLRMLSMMEEFENILNHRLRLTGVIATMVAPSSVSETHYLRLLAEHKLLGKISRRVGRTQHAILASDYAEIAEKILKETTVC